MSTRQIHAFAQLIDQLPLGVEESELIDGAVAENSARLLSGSFVRPFAYASSSSHLNSTTGVDGSPNGPFSLFACSASLETNHPADGGSCLHGGGVEDPHHSLSWRGQGDGVDNGQPNPYRASSDTAGHHLSSSLLLDEVGDAKRNSEAVGWSAGRGEEKNVHLVNRFDMAECHEIRTLPRCSSESFKTTGVLHGRHVNNGDMSSSSSSSSFLGLAACAKKNESPEDYHCRSFHGRGENGGGADGCSSFLLGVQRTDETAASTPTTSVRTPISGRCGEQGSFMCMMGASPSPQCLETLHSQNGERVIPCDGSGGEREVGHGRGTGNTGGACFSSAHYGNHLTINIGVSTPCSSTYSSSLQQHCPSNGDSVSASPGASEHPQYHSQSVQVKTEGRRGGPEGPVMEEMSRTSGSLLVKNSEPREWGSGCMRSHINNDYTIRSMERGVEGGVIANSPDRICTPNNKRAANGEQRSMYCDDGTPTTNAAASSLSTPSPGYSDHGQSNEEKQPISSSYCSHDGIHINQTIVMSSSSSCPAAFHTSSPSHPERSPRPGCPPQACMASNQTMPRLAAKQADCCCHCPSVSSSPYPLESPDDTNGKTTKQALASSHGNRHHHTATESYSTFKDLTISAVGAGSTTVVTSTSHGHNIVAPNQYGTGPSSCSGLTDFGDGGGGRRDSSGREGGYTSFPCSPSSPYDVKMENHSTDPRHALSNELTHDCTDVVIAPAAFSSSVPENSHQQCSENQLQSMTPFSSSPLSSSHPPLSLESLSEGSAHFASPVGTKSSNGAPSSHTSSYANQHHPVSASPSASNPLLRNCEQQGMSYPSSSVPPAPHGFSRSYNETTTGTNEVCVPPPLVDGSSRSGGLGIYPPTGEQESGAPPPPAPYQYGDDNLCPVYHSHHSSSPPPPCTQQSSLHSSPMNDGPPSSSPGFYGDDSRGTAGQCPHGGHPLQGDVGESLSSQCLPCSPSSLQQKPSGPSTTLPPSQNNGLAGGNHPLHFHECGAGSQQGNDPSSVSCSPSSALVHRRVAVAETGGTGVGGGSNPSPSSLPLKEKTTTFSNGPNAPPRKRSSCSKKKGTATARSATLKKSGGVGGPGERETQLASTRSGDFKCDAELYPNSSDSSDHKSLHQVPDVVLRGMGGCSSNPCNASASVVSLEGAGEDLTGAEMYKGSPSINQRRVKTEGNRNEDTSTGNSSATLPRWSSDMVGGHSQRGEQNNLSANRSKSSWSSVFGPVNEPSPSPLVYPDNSNEGMGLSETDKEKNGSGTCQIPSFKVDHVYAQGAGQLVVDLVRNATGERHSICIERESLLDCLAVARIAPLSHGMFKSSELDPSRAKGGQQTKQGRAADGLPSMALLRKHATDREDDLWRGGRNGRGGERHSGSRSSDDDHSLLRNSDAPGVGVEYCDGEERGERRRIRGRGSSDMSVISTSACTKDSCSGSSAHSEGMSSDSCMDGMTGEVGDSSTSGTSSTKTCDEAAGKKKAGLHGDDFRSTAGACFMTCETPRYSDGADFVNNKEEGITTEKHGSSHHDGRGRKGKDEKERLEELVRTMQMELSRLTAEVHELSSQQDGEARRGGDGGTSKGFHALKTRYLSRLQELRPYLGSSYNDVLRAVIDCRTAAQLRQWKSAFEHAGPSFCSPSEEAGRILEVFRNGSGLLNDHHLYRLSPYEPHDSASHSQTGGGGTKSGSLVMSESQCSAASSYNISRLLSDAGGGGDDSDLLVGFSDHSSPSSRLANPGLTACGGTTSNRYQHRFSSPPPYAVVRAPSLHCESHLMAFRTAGIDNEDLTASALSVSEGLLSGTATSRANAGGRRQIRRSGGVMGALGYHQIALDDRRGRSPAGTGVSSKPSTSLVGTGGGGAVMGGRSGAKAVVGGGGQQQHRLLYRNPLLLQARSCSLGEPTVGEGEEEQEIPHHHHSAYGRLRFSSQRLPTMSSLDGFPSSPCRLESLQKNLSPRSPSILDDPAASLVNAASISSGHIHPSFLGLDCTTGGSAVPAGAPSAGLSDCLAVIVGSSDRGTGGGGGGYFWGSSGSGGDSRSIPDVTGRGEEQFENSSSVESSSSYCERKHNSARCSDKISNNSGAAVTSEGNSPCTKQVCSPLSSVGVARSGNDVGEEENKVETPGRAGGGSSRVNSGEGSSLSPRNTKLRDGSDWGQQLQGHCTNSLESTTSSLPAIVLTSEACERSENGTPVGGVEEDASVESTTAETLSESKEEKDALPSMHSKWGDGRLHPVLGDEKSSMPLVKEAGTTCSPPSESYTATTGSFLNGCQSYSFSTSPSSPEGEKGEMRNSVFRPHAEKGRRIVSMIKSERDHFDGASAGSTAASDS
ncbi:hypothetical protein CSUI_008040 [Cystoisospora suis]|uniref:Uncharacterized protein n=1 Tax=Cystoisospora suis TaxID=483139 RepID=A0A2C6KKQ5_9APIC|nr:hypothetical protein CSUI_008040 [Cystoisospora suis]